MRDYAHHFAITYHRTLEAKTNKRNIMNPEQFTHSSQELINKGAFLATEHTIPFLSLCIY